MTGRTLCLMGAAAAFLSVTTLVSPMRAFAQAPTLAGTWQPSDPARSDELFAVGLTAIPGSGRVTIEQRPDRLTVTISIPDDKLDPILRVSGRFYPAIIYRISETAGRFGGAGAGGPHPPAMPTWFGEKLVIPDARPGARPITMTYSIDGSRLKVETRVDLDGTRANTVTEWFTRVR
jgi:hypothetical protein